MEIMVSKCDTANKNNIVYPLKEMKKCVSAFNKLSQKDSKRCVYYSRMPNSQYHELTLGKIKKLKVKDGIVYADFEFADNDWAKDTKSFYDECISKGVSSSHFDFRIMMDVMADLDSHICSHFEDKDISYQTAKDIEVCRFVFGLDSCWR